MGTAILAVFFGKLWSATPWQVLPRAQLIKQGRQLADRFGLNVTDWTPYTVATVSKSLANAGKGVSPLGLRITYISPHGGQRAEVGFTSSGVPNYWRVPASDKPARRSGASESQAAQAAFQIMAGAESGSYKAPSHFMGDDVDEETYTWRKPRTANPGLVDSITVSTRHSAVTRVERKIYFSSNSGDDAESDENPGYWDILGGVFGVVCIAGVIAILSIYLLWLIRRAVSHQFPMRLAGIGLLLMTMATFFGTDWQKSHSLSQHEDLPIVFMLFLAAMLMTFAAVGRGISAATRSKWTSLEQLCLLAPISKSTGEAIAAGVLFSPLLAAIPFLVAACGLIPNAWVLPYKLDALYSRSPILDSMNVETGIYLLGFFGFALPALGRLIRYGFLRWLILLPLGTLFFADQTRLLSGPLAAPLAAGLLTFALLWYVWAQFDLLTVLTLHFASSTVMVLLMRAQKTGEVWWPLAAIGGMLLLAFWIGRRGQDVTDGDRLATIPGLIGFRAEREKLQAEFSLARRAQQGMLPHTPEIAGYSLAASCTPSLEVGGDLYDFVNLPDGRVGIGVADVSGKGVPAALYMTLTKGLLASISKDNSQLTPIVEEMNRHLHAVTRKKVFVTMALGFLDVPNRILQCVRAGHNPIVWRQASQGATVLVSPGGLGLGITAGRVFSTQLQVAEMKLTEGDAVVFYSDGITEAMNSSLELFGEQRLMSAVDRTDSLNAAETRDSILNEVREFLGGIHPQDDMTVVVLRVGSSGELALDPIQMRG